MSMTKIQQIADNYLSHLSSESDVKPGRVYPCDFWNVKRLLLLVRDDATLSDELRGRYLGYCEGVLEENGYYFDEGADSSLLFSETLRETYVGE